jgi:hypothetical protein
MIAYTPKSAGLKRSFHECLSFLLDATSPLAIIAAIANTTPP